MIASDPRPPYPGHTLAADPIVGVSPLTRQGFGLAHCIKCVHTSKDHPYPALSKTSFVGYLKYTVQWYADYGWTVRILRCDMEAVLNSKEVQEFLDSKNIRVQNSAPYTHNQNTSERNIQTLLKGTSTMLHAQSILDASWWGDALVHFANVRSHVPNKILGNRSPMQVITGRATNLSNVFMFAFGEPVLVAKVEPEKTFKFDVKNNVGIYIGQPEGQVDSHFIWLPFARKVVNRSKAIRFNISQAQLDKYHSRQADMLRPRPIANTLKVLLDFNTLSDANDYNIADQLEQLENPTANLDILEPTFPRYVEAKLNTQPLLQQLPEGDHSVEASVEQEDPTINDQSFVGETSLPYTEKLPTAASTSPESLIDRILSYTGDPADWRSLEFKVRFSDGEIFYHFYPAMSPTIAFTQFQLEHPELKDLAPLSARTLAKYKINPGRKKKRVKFRVNIATSMPYVEPTAIDIPASFNKRKKPDDPTTDIPDSPSQRLFKARDLTHRTDLDDLDDPFLYPFNIELIAHREIVAYMAKALLSDEPTIKVALKSEMRVEWIEAIKAEVLNLITTGTIKAAKRSDIKKGDQIIYFTMKLKVKRYADGQVDKLKARGCAMGNMLSKMPGMQNYSPTVSNIVAAAVLGLATYLKLKDGTVDTVSAFLMQAYKDNPALFIKFPMEVCLAAGLDPDVIYRIYQYLYGLPDAGRAYYEALALHLINGGYTRSNFDSCLFYKFVNKELILLSIHVDDTYVAASVQHLIEEFKDHLRLKFKITFKDTIHTYLGVQHTVNHDESLTLTQTKLLNDLFTELGITSATSQETISIETNRTTSSDQPYAGTNYRKVVGQMGYILNSRPDLAFIISEGATHNTNPTNYDYQQLKNAGQYLYNTKDIGLTLPTQGNYYDKTLTITCWVDASYLIHTSSGKSHTGYCFSLGNQGMFYSKSSVQQLVATSSTHAEMRALFTAVKDLVFLIGLFEELGFTVTHPVSVYEDNNACVILANQEIGPNRKCRHFIMLVEYCRQQVALGLINVQHIDTEDNIADILTKNIYNTKLFKKHRDSLLGLNSSNRQSDF
jgi:ASC-1-like (ASCH) protein